MEKKEKKPLSITELDVEPISDDELQSLSGGGESSYYSCCSGSSDITIVFCDVE